MREVKQGCCKSCGKDLVQVIDNGAIERTYHPADISDPNDPCPVLLTIPGTNHRSFDVLPFYFMPKKD